MQLPLYFHKTGAVSTDPYNPSQQSAIQIKFGSSWQIAFQFPDGNGVPREIDLSPLVLNTFEFVLKKLSDYDGPAVVLNYDSGVWVVTKTGSGATSTYSISPSFGNTTLFELFITQIGGVVAARPADVTARYALTGLAQNAIVQQVDNLTYWRLVNPASITSSAGWDNDIPLADSVTLGGELLIDVSGSVSKSLPFTITVLASYTVAGVGMVPLDLPTYPVPSALVTLTGAQAITGVKTLTAPVLNEPTTTNPAETVQTLTDGASIAWDLNAGGIGVVTLGGNHAMAAPTNFRAGATYILEIIQDATGSRTLTWDAIFVWPNATAPTLTPTAGKRDIITFCCHNSKLYGIAALNFA